LINVIAQPKLSSANLLYTISKVAMSKFQHKQKNKQWGEMEDFGYDVSTQKPPSSFQVRIFHLAQGLFN